MDRVFVYDLIVIGGGAAGFFGAITAANEAQIKRILLLEKTGNCLAKVKVSGGGRCNVTHYLFDLKNFAAQYPRGKQHLFKLLFQFGPQDTINWFESRGVPIKNEADGRMFPQSNQSSSIINCLMQECENNKIEIKLHSTVTEILPTNNYFELTVNDEKLRCKKLLITTGGHPKKESFDWLHKLGLAIEPPVPSLFTFNVKNHTMVSLMGLSVEHARIRIEGTKLEETGPILITHWGFSGPAVLRCSAWGARKLAELNYKFNLRIHWLPDLTQDEIRDWLEKQRTSNAKRAVHSRVFDGIPARLWEHLCAKSQIDASLKWADISAKKLNLLVESISADLFEVQGKTTFKEEFVTCGGIKLSEIDSSTCMSKKIPNLYFAGEVLDVDGITGGFNFQHAWASGFVAGKSMKS